MFSYFENGIKNIIPTKNIDLAQLVKLIKNNPQQTVIEDIRQLRSNGKEYESLKRTLAYITPNCMVRERDLKGEKQTLNLISMSQYIFIDIDDIRGYNSVEDYKNYIIERYGDKFSLVCNSSSLGGVSILFKVTNTVTADNFISIWTYIADSILSDEIVDLSTCDIGRAMFVSYDPNAFYNYENEIDVEITHTQPVNEKETHYNSYREDNITVGYSFSKIPIEEVLEKMIFTTKVNVENPVVDFKPMDYATIFIKKGIMDGTKHKIYAKALYTLLYLNPELDKDYFLNYLFYINSTYTNERMESKELIRFFHHIYNIVKQNGVPEGIVNTKNFHINPNCTLDKKERNDLTNKLNGILRKSSSISLIQNAKQQLEGKKYTQKQIAEISGLSLKTVQKYYNEQCIDIHSILDKANYPEKYN